MRARYSTSRRAASSSASHAEAFPSDGARQSPRGESDPPALTFGPFGTAERLNCENPKKRFRNTSSQRRISARSYSGRPPSGKPAGQRPEVFWASAPDAFEVLGRDKLLAKAPDVANPKDLFNLIRPAPARNESAAQRSTMNRAA